METTLENNVAGLMVPLESTYHFFLLEYDATNIMCNIMNIAYLCLIMIFSSNVLDPKPPI